MLCCFLSQLCRPTQSDGHSKVRGWHFRSPELIDNHKTSRSLQHLSSAMYTYLTSGAFSDIFVDRENRLCLKETNVAPKPHNHIRELAILTFLKDHAHSSVVPLLEERSVDSEHDIDTVRMVFPYYETSVLELAARQDVLSPNVVRVLSDLCSAIDHIHGLGILHRDINPNNVMVDMRRTPIRGILIDFGISWSKQHALGEDPGHLITAIGTG